MVGDEFYGGAWGDFPEANSVVCSGGDDGLTAVVEVNGDYFVLVTVLTAEHGDAAVGADVPQADRKVLGGREDDVHGERVVT